MSCGNYALVNFKNKDEVLDLVLKCSEQGNVLDSIKKTAPTINALISKAPRETIAFLIENEALEILDFNNHISYRNDSGHSGNGHEAWKAWKIKMENMFKNKTKRDWMKPATGSLGGHLADLNKKKYPKWPAPGLRNEFDVGLNNHKMALTCPEGNKMAVSCAGEMHMEDWRTGSSNEFRTSVEGNAKIKGIILNHHKLVQINNMMTDCYTFDGEEECIKLVKDSYQRLEIEARKTKLFALKARMRRGN